jgi:parallel beta-helix repeat protein
VNSKLWAMRIAFPWILLTSVFADIVSADILQVPNHFLSIQEAVNAAGPGDTILVSSGAYRLYSGNINIAKQDITLKSAYGPNKTAIEGRGGTPVITLAKQSRALIDGFTITVMKGTGTKALEGGGIYCGPSSSPTIINNIIVENDAVFGAGIYCGPSSSPTIKNNVISRNTSLKFGGGICCYSASPTILSNKIMGNEASNSGGGIFCYRDSSLITNNVLWKNRAKFGAGISCDRSSCVVINNAIANNEALYGGGIFFEAGSIRIINTILWNNNDDLYSERFSPASRPNYSDIGNGDFRGLNGNISADPLFIDAARGNLRLKSNSPCVDAGNPDRIYNDPDGSRNDMGAYGGPKAGSLGIQGN